MNQEELNFNQAPKKGNKALIIGVIVIVVTLVVLGNYIFGKTSKSNNNADMEDVNSSSDLESNFDFDDESTNNAKEPQYESVDLTAVEVFKDETIDYKITDVVNNGLVNYLVTGDRKILYNNTYGYNHILTADDNFKNIFPNTFENTLVIENKDNTYSIYEAPDMENNLTINAEGLVAAYWDYGTLSVFTLENEILYYAWYKEVDGKVETDKGAVIIDEGDARGQNGESLTYTGKIKYAKPTERSIAIMREDGTVYYLGLSIYDFIPEDGYEFDTERTYKIINNADEILADATITYYLKPFYSIKGDNKNIYVREVDYSSVSSITSPISTKVALPDNYEVDDIKGIHVVKEILLETDDGNVFYKEEASEDAQWEKIEELTELNKESHIIKIVDTYSSFLVLCDDGYLYRYNK